LISEAKRSENSQQDLQNPVYIENKDLKDTLEQHAPRALGEPQGHPIMKGKGQKQKIQKNTFQPQKAKVSSVNQSRFSSHKTLKQNSNNIKNNQEEKSDNKDDNSSQSDISEKTVSCCSKEPENFQNTKAHNSQISKSITRPIKGDVQTLKENQSPDKVKKTGRLAKPNPNESEKQSSSYVRNSFNPTMVSGKPSLGNDMNIVYGHHKSNKSPKKTLKDEQKPQDNSSSKIIEDTPYATKNYRNKASQNKKSSLKKHQADLVQGHSPTLAMTGTLWKITCTLLFK
jgi:hypothetical protein